MSATFQDYYNTLGVTRIASALEIKKAYRKLAREHHPDVAKNKATAEARIREINEAYEVLGDPETRSTYDQLGTENVSFQNRARPSATSSGEGRRQEFHFGGTGFSDFFEQYFNKKSRNGFPMGEQGGADIEGDIFVTLEESMHGSLRPVTLQWLNRETGQTEVRNYKIRIPPGAVDGRRIRIAGQGEPGQGGAPAGDLLLKVRHAPHPEFTSREADLFHELDIAPWEAVLGAEVIVSTLDGTIKLRIPAGSENGTQMRLRDRGLPKGKTGERGNLFFVLKVLLPTTLSDAERVAWETLRNTSTFRPRM